MTVERKDMNNCARYSLYKNMDLYSLLWNGGLVLMWKGENQGVGWGVMLLFAKGWSAGTLNDNLN